MHQVITDSGEAHAQPTSSLARMCLTWSLYVTVTVTGCGPAVPGRVADTSPLSARAESAPLPELGSTFVDQPLTDADHGGGHSMHGEHSMHGGDEMERGGAPAAVDAGDHAAHEDTDAGSRDHADDGGSASAQPQDHSMHDHGPAAEPPSSRPTADAGSPQAGHGGHGGQDGP